MDLINFLIGNNHHIDRANLWSFLSFIVGAGALWIAYFQLGVMARIARADFIEKFSKDLSGDKVGLLLTLLDKKVLKFKEGDSNNSDSVNLFILDKELWRKLAPKAKIYNPQDTYTTYEIDDLLDCFEQIGYYLLKEKIFTVDSVYEMFFTYIEFTWLNEDIQKYITYERRRIKKGDDIYTYFDALYKECKKYQDNKR